jgi:Ca-activated chloride channel family protein
VHFLSPAWLLLLFGVLVLAGVYLWAQTRKKQYAVRFTNLDLLGSVAPARPGWRKHVVAAVFGAAAVLLVLALARPARTVDVPREEATIILAIDTSLSMQATDVAPTRLEAAQQAATTFVEELPEELLLGLVSFSGTTALEVPPGTDRQAAVDAIAGLDLDQGTAIGEGIFASLDAIEDVPADPGGEAPPAAIVLLSDGETTVGRENDEAVTAAAAAGVPVSTIAFGTQEGIVEIQGEVVSVAVDEPSLQAIAEGTGGQSFSALSEGELRSVYDTIGTQVGYQEEERDISRWFLGLGLMVLMLCGGLSLAWSSRIL